jgi:putative FmdB family regulatory protein
MPIYEYTCNGCNHGFEYYIISSNQDDPICPKCYSKDVKKQISGSSFRLKGEGWADQGYQKK